MAEYEKKEPRSPVKRKDFEKQGLNLDENMELKQAFNVFDTDGDGLIEVGELIHAVRKLGFLKKNKIIGNMIIDQCNRLAREHPEGVNFEQFQDAITVRLGERHTEEGCKRIFDLMDEDSDMQINSTDLKFLARELGESLSIDELTYMLQLAGDTDEPSINFEEFIEIMNKRQFA